MSKNNTEILALGLMSGTSLDGIDAALIKSNGDKVIRYGKPYQISYSAAEKVALHNGLSEARQVGAPTDQNSLINQLENMITNRHIDAVRGLLDLNSLKSDDIDIIGFHGQTILHGPDEGWTWQIGLGKRLAEELGITVVNDFRRNDMEQGGQGAPFVPIYHHAIMKNFDLEYPVAFLNVGGVGNMTWIGSDKEKELIAFDTGPGNALLDDWVAQQSDNVIDQDGVYSKLGKVDGSIVDKWLENDYFNLVPPKSLDRNNFDVEGLNSLSLEDGAATLCSFTARTIKEGERKCPSKVKSWFVCGGGVQNPTIMKMLEDTLDGKVRSVNELGFNSEFVEAEAFAYLAVRKLYDLPVTFPGTTGVNAPSTGGVINTPT
ncbi:MAG: anhydro-N-acetylmuramic acid kinase [Kordiimonadaceae bacterium]|jgi:anhydro-N-acetylmuramic acid kinase|nr:anhydro-N-acetylmuramic acid kinase [Kordiimonadaceae bacterium]MBT6032804.1 anhydro-N-acetylmuramic acid kinase [Kordiimonadaceae bacterium]